MSRLSRTKGAAYERALANELSDALGFVVQRKLGQARDGGYDLTECGPFVIEAKRRAKIAVYDWMAQVEKAAQAGQTPVVVMRADGKDSLALLRLRDFIPLMRGEIVAPELPTNGATVAQRLPQ